MTDQANQEQQQSNTPDILDSGAGTEKSQQAQASNLLESLPEELRRDPTIASFKSVEDLVKSYKSAQSMLGSSIRIPGPDASEDVKKAFFEKVQSVEGVVKLPNPENEEEVNQFLNKLGRPESPDDYAIELPEGLQPELINPNMQAEFKQLSHKLGLTQSQANALAKFELSKVKEQQDAQLAKYEAGKQALKQLWGQDFEARASGAKQMIETLKAKYPDMTNDLLQTSVTNPLIYVMLAELNQSYKEKGKIPASQSINYGLTPEEARARISELLDNRASALHDASHPDHQRQVEHMRKLYLAAYPSNGQAQ